jgi:hypothetical protein
VWLLVMPWIFISDYLENEINDHILGTGVAFPQPTNWLSLHHDHPAETGANELAGGGYARQTAAFNASAAGLADNTDQEQWTNLTDAAGEVLFIGAWDAVSAGNFLWYAPLGGTPATFTAQATGDVFTSHGHTLANDDRVFVTAWPGSALPTGAAENTVYWVVGVAGDTFQLSTTMGGAAITLTADGEGIAYFIDVRTFNSGDTFQLAAGDLNFQSN